QRFELIVMSGHACPVLVRDDALRVALSPNRAALTGDGRFAFESRNPEAKAWERWTTDRVVEVSDSTVTVVRMTNVGDGPVGDTVSFTSTYTSPRWPAPKRSRSTLRFLDAPALASFLVEAGIPIE